jgi:hypothetical protein
MPSKLLLRRLAGLFFSVMCLGAWAGKSHSAEVQATPASEQGRRIDRLMSGSQFKDIPPFQLQGPPGPPPDAPDISPPIIKKRPQESELPKERHPLPIFDLDR